MRLTVFLGGFGVLALWEWRFPKRSLSQARTQRWLTNFSVVICSTVAVRIILPLAAVGMAYLVQQEHWGLATHLDLPFWVKVIGCFVLLDLAIYFQHAFFHVIPVMWRFHRMHHSDLDCDVTTGLRFHPVEIVISMLIKFSVIVALGAPVLSVILFEMMLNLMSMFTHSNIYLNPKVEQVMRWFLVTPDMHRIHRSCRENETNSNFSFNISLWDRIFGTYMVAPEGGQQGMSIGLDQFREAKWQRLAGLLYMPFVASIRGYAINLRDSRNEDELSLARLLAYQNQEKARLASELASYIHAIDKIALVSTTDAAGNITQVNDKFCEVSGYSRDDLLGQNHRIVNSGAHPKTFFVKLWETIVNGKIWHGEICNRSKNGELYWVESSIVPIYAEGKIDRYISIRFNISKRKLAESELKALNESLETKVATRTHDLSVAMEQADAANKAKSRFLSNMSHEFRTPLHSILSFSSIGLKKLDSLPKESLRQYLSDINYSGENLLGLVNNLLDLSKLEADNIKYDYQLIDIKEVINRVVCELSMLATVKHMHVEVIAPEEAVMVMIDRGKIAQVIRNLVSNALKFSPENERIEISISNNAAGEVEVIVSDHGVGIPPGEIEVVFDPFVQSSSTQSNSGGTGLGLSICKEIVQRGHNGRIYAEHGENGGSRFIFSIGDVGELDSTDPATLSHA